MFMGYYPQESLYKPYKYHGYTVRGTPNCPLKSGKSQSRPLRTLSSLTSFTSPSQHQTDLIVKPFREPWGSFEPIFIHSSDFKVLLPHRKDQIALYYMCVVHIYIYVLFSIYMKYPVPPWGYIQPILETMGYTAYQLVQGFFHQQYVGMTGGQRTIGLLRVVVEREWVP